MSLIVEVATLIVAIILIYILWKILKLVSYLIVNSILGVLIFFLLNSFFGVGIPISLLSVGIVALAGIPGVLLVLLIHFLGQGF